MSAEQRSNLATYTRRWSVWGSGTSLADKVGQAQKALARGDITATYNSLRAFINQVKASGQKIDATTAASLVADATRITKVLGY